MPTRSALLGLLAAALGIRRDEEERLNAFNQHYHLAIHDLATQTRWLRDYHTVSAPRENKKRRYYTRRDELCQAPEEVGTIVSQREYRCDGYWHIAVSATAQAPYSLEQLRQALLEPHFPLYLGRKSCPLALPMQPEVRSGTLKEVFTEAAQALLSATAEALFPPRTPKLHSARSSSLLRAGGRAFSAPMARVTGTTPKNPA
ncbi:type I-E CRISPR-associated protein Cas5/CasD [Apirhabdus apintestini]|nr:type I-E CRISPR-associated protein Cas5/CasD [Enterobacteriaceae bacterium CA-0114]